MRVVPGGALSYLQSRYGTEPIFIVEVAWAGDTTKRIAYSDQKIEGADYPHPTLLSISNFDTSLKIKGASDSQNTTITLDDVDGYLRELLDIHDIQKAPVWIYQSFKGLSYSQKFLLFRGEIVSPVTWSEGDRTLQFDVLSKTTDTEVAFSMEEGDFPNVPEDALGKVWPLTFGTVCNMQAVPVRSPRKGYLVRGEGIHDFTIEPRICQAHFLQCKSVVIDSREVPNPDYNPNSTCKSGTDCTQQGTGYHPLVCQPACVNEPETVTQETWGPDPSCIEDRFDTICELEDLLEKQKAYEHAVIVIRGGDKFPQGRQVTLDIDGAKFIGVFSGENFAIIDRKHPDYDTTEHTLCHAVATIYSGHYEAIHWNSTWVLSSDNQTWYVPQIYHAAETCTEEPAWVSVAMDGAELSQKAFDDMPTASFCWLPAGSEVFLEEETEVLYIVSIIPGTVNSVAAYKKQQTTGRELLMTVPATYYTVYETDYIGYVVTEIGFTKPLSKIDDSWSDDIYVSFTSDVGPNPVDIISWLLTKYTNLTFDPVSKAYVKSRLVNYPNNFCVKTKMNVFQLMQDIAYQSRCALYVRDDVMFIVYLSKEPTSLRTLTEADIIANTFNVKLSDSSDLVTKYTATWRETEAGVVSTDNVDNKLVLKYNVTKYGINEETTDYYTQNTFSTILKSSTFWLIRLANTWKQVEFDTPLTMLDLDLFDCVTLDVAQLSSTPVKTIITGIQYNNEDNTIHFECLTPIRSGETIPYRFFWPADIDAANLFPPTQEEINAGAGYPFIITPPVGHILRGGDVVLDDETHVILSAGDQYPSDIGDVLPTANCKISDVMDIVEPDPVIEALQLARKAFEATRSTSKSPPYGEAGAGQAPPPCEECGISCNDHTNVCTWQVTVTTVIPFLCKGCGQMWCNPYDCGGGGGKTVCTGIVQTCCYTFGSYSDAVNFRNGQLGNMAAGVVTCDDGTVMNTGFTQGVSQPQVHYGKNMDQHVPSGGWTVSKEYDLCSHQIDSFGFGAGGSLGNSCTCTCAHFGGCGSHNIGEQWKC